MSKKWISLPRQEGIVSRQAHADLPPNSYEREVGQEGFFGPSSHFYHTHPPTSWSAWEGPTRPRAFDANKLANFGNSPWQAKALLGNAKCLIRYWQCAQPMTQLARNGDGDDLLFIHEGSGDLFSDYGHMPYRDGDYIMLPRGTAWRIEPKENTAMLMIEATGSHYMLPDRGLLGEQALFDPSVLETPKLNDQFRAQQSENPWQIVFKRRGALNTISYPFNPLDAMGWKGQVSVVKLNWRDFRPVISARMHLAPSVHTTFVAERFVVCTFAPRPVESDPGALKLPFFHNNDDFDEVLFYHRGNFVSRDNIHPGMLTFHPSGFTHGPHPKALKAAEKHTRLETDEVAVMIDTRDALDVQDEALATEWHKYVESWQ